MAVSWGSSWGRPRGTLSCPPTWLPCGLSGLDTVTRDTVCALAKGATYISQSLPAFPSSAHLEGGSPHLEFQQPLPDPRGPKGEQVLLCGWHNQQRCASGGLEATRSVLSLQMARVPCTMESAARGSPA